MVPLCLLPLQGGSASVGMALAEPLGGSLFASNIVFGCVVLVAHRMGNVSTILLVETASVSTQCQLV
jgi:hypothetical protein